MLKELPLMEEGAEESKEMTWRHKRAEVALRGQWPWMVSLNRGEAQGSQMTKNRKGERRGLEEYTGVQETFVIFCMVFLYFLDLPQQTCIRFTI